MGHNREMPPLDEHLPVLRPKGNLRAAPCRIPVEFQEGPAIFVHVRRRGERRRDFLRRHRFRGVDQLRSQQTEPEPSDPQALWLDVLL